LVTVVFEGVKEMSVRSIRRLSAFAALLSVTAALAACGGKGASEAYTGPGWYLEKPYLLVVAGPRVFAGPMSYDKCEEERAKIGGDAATQMLCVQHVGKPTKHGFY